MLHACCAPCALEPVDIFASDNHKITLAYVNSNIAPVDEYTKRLNTLHELANSKSLQVIEGDLSEGKVTWEKKVAPFGYAESSFAPDTLKARCRMCYRIRLEESAKIAHEKGFEAISTTLSISPYQYTAVVKDELERAAAKYSIVPVFKDFRPNFKKSQERARALNYYLQDCCGCRFSSALASSQRAQNKHDRKLKKEIKRALKRASNQQSE